MPVLAVGYLVLATWLAWLVADQEAPRRVGVFARVALVSAVKFALFAPISLLHLARARWAERRRLSYQSR